MKPAHLVGLVASAALVGVVAAPTSQAQPQALAAASGEQEIPILGQANTLGTADGGPPAVVTVHRVARTEGATIVYWSLGVPEGSKGEFGSSFLGPSTTSFFTSDVGPRQGDVGLIDTAGTQVFRPLVPTEKFTPCICSSQDAVFALKPGQAGVVWSAVAPLPAEVTTVDVVVAEQVIPDVPVEDGLMEPLAKDQEEPIILGTGWPEVDQDLLARATVQDPQAYPITARVSNLEQSITTSTGEVALAADVLFAKDSASLTAKGKATVAEAATAIKAEGAGQALTVTGHTDSDGSDSYNLALSKKRAGAVAAELRKKLGKGYTLTTAGKGETQPVADNTSTTGQAKNRRVSITVTGGQ